MFIELVIKSVTLVHGYDARNQEILEQIAHPEPVRKLVPLARIQSIGERYVLVASGFERQAYWEYVGDYEQLKRTLECAGTVCNAAGPRRA